MSAQSRKLQYKTIRAAASSYVGTAGDIWYEQGTTTLRFYNGDPGGELLSSGGTSTYLDYGQLPTNQNRAIDLTYKNHWLCDLNTSYHYTLADGVDGQELSFFASSGLNGGGIIKSTIWVNSAKFLNTGTSSWTSGVREFLLFATEDEVLTNAVAKVTATWFNGSWHFDGGRDLGDPT
jgi:hypothetical protein